MDIHRFTEKAQEALASAQTKAARYGHQQVDVEHVLADLLEQEGGLATSLFNAAQVQTKSLKEHIEQELERIPKVTTPSGATGQVYVSGRLSRLLMQAEDEAKKLKDEFISVEHLLLAMTDDGGPTGRVFKKFGATRERLMHALQEIRGSHRVTTPNP